MASPATDTRHPAQAWSGSGQLEHPARRIVSLLPSATEIVCALGLADRLVAVTHECDHPAAALKHVPRITSNLLPSELRRSDEIDAAVRAAVTSGLRRIVRHWDVVRLDDLTANPRSTGYRAVHVIVRRMGHLVEIQLRTPRQHEWALAVERAAARYWGMEDLKDGRGPGYALAYFERVALALALEEVGD